MTKRLLFRVDANQEIGYGHLTRCLSIADSIDNFEITFFSTDNLETYFKDLKNEKYHFIQLKESKDFLSIIKLHDIVIIDGYNFDSSYHEAIHSLGAKIISIDDLANRKLLADVILNPTPALSSQNYICPIYTQFYIGLDYALLRKAFLELAQKGSVTKSSNSMMICFGGSDPLNITLRALKEVIKSEKFLAIHCVLGPGYVFFESLIEFESENIHFHKNLQEAEMALLMETCEFGILPCSGILLEGITAKMKIISGYYIENQTFVYQQHLKMKTFVDAKNFSSSDITSALLVLNETIPPSTLIDGHSIAGIHKIIKQISSEDEYSIREADITDCNLTFSWANHPTTRQFSFNKEKIDWEEHLKWFSKKIQSPFCYYLVLEMKSNLVGSIRFDILDKIATISYLVAPDYHGLGIGNILFRKGLIALEKKFTMNELDTIQGFVFKDNIPSVKTFERYNFKQQINQDTFLFTKKFTKND